VPSDPTLADPVHGADRPSPPAVLVTGAPATGKSTLARQLARLLDGALLDQDVATGPMVDVVSGLVGVDDLDHPRLAGLTRAARYEVLTALAVDNLAVGRPVVLVAPFTRERSDLAAWDAIAGRLTDAGGRPLLVWIELPVEEILVRLRRRAASRDVGKLAQGAAYERELIAAGAAPVVPHLALDGRAAPAELARLVLSELGH
jgi:predicted kinase